MLIVEVVDVVVVAYLDVSAVLAVFMVVGFGGHVVSGSALVVVPVMGMVKVPAVEIVDVAGMFHRAMPAVRPVDVGVLFVDRVRGFRRHFLSSLLRSSLRTRVGAGLPATCQRVIRTSDVPVNAATIRPSRWGSAMPGSRTGRAPPVRPARTARLPTPAHACDEDRHPWEQNPEQCLKPVDEPGGVYLPGDRVEVLKQ
jgi:hypothetical protein